MKRLLGGRKAALVVGLSALLALSVTQPAMAAGGAGTGTSSFCLSTGDCGTLVLSENYVNVIERGGVIEWACAVALPSSDPNFIGVSITRCWVEHQETGEQHDGLQAGNAGPATATAGGSTTLEDDGDYDVCVSGLGLYLDGARPYTECLSPILTF